MGKFYRIKSANLFYVSFSYLLLEVFTGVVLANSGIDIKLYDTYYVTAHLFDITEAVYGVLNHRLFREVRTTLRNANLPPREEESSRDLLVLRSRQTPSRSSGAGYGCGSVRQFHACARLLDEGKRGSAPTEMTSAIESSDTTGELKERDLKLDIHKQSENSEPLPSEGCVGGVTIQNGS